MVTYRAVADSTGTGFIGTTNLPLGARHLAAFIDFLRFALRDLGFEILRSELLVVNVPNVVNL